jgi:type IV pilus assembly protein PilB
MARKQEFLGEILVKKGFITDEDLESALSYQKTNKKFLGSILLSRGLITDQQLFEAFSEQFNLPLVHIKDKPIDWDLVDMFPKSLIIEHRCFPLEKTEDSIIIAVNDPLDAWIVTEAEVHAKDYKIERILTFNSDIDEMLEKHHQHVKEKTKKLFGI